MKHKAIITITLLAMFLITQVIGLFVVNMYAPTSQTIIDPETGELKFIPLPFNAEEIVFDQHGMAYLRTTDVVARYDSRTWREVPWDYGEELARVTSAMDRMPQSTEMTSPAPPSFKLWSASLFSPYPSSSRSGI